MKKFIKISLIVIALLLFIAFVFRSKLLRLQYALSMFSGVEQVERFRSMEKYFPTHEITPGDSISAMPQIENINLPANFVFNDTLRNTAEFMKDIDVTGFIVIKNDTLVFENYFRGNTSSSHTIAWSMSKSFVSALVGIAVKEGKIRSLNDVAGKYVPQLKGTAYENVTLKNLLQMSSGVRWNEDYSDFNSDINRFGRVLALGLSFEKFLMKLDEDKAQGTYNRYNSSDTQVLGMVLTSATGYSISEYLELKIWKPLGMEGKAWWLVDDHGIEFAAAGLSASLRDYARFGELYLHKGTWNNLELVPASWVKQSHTPDAIHLLPGENDLSDFDLGYGFQWWILDGNEGEYTALGVYNQFIYINPTHNVVIVQSCANSSYGATNDESSYREFETIELFREIVSTLK